MIETKKRKPARSTRRKNILVPVDFSPASQRAYETALDLIRCRGQIILMHVIPHWFVKGHISADSIKAARKNLRAFANSADTVEGHRIRLLVRAGTPFEEILGAMKDHNPSLIVLGIDESNPFGGLALGHTAERVSRYAWCSVLLVRGGSAYTHSAPKAPRHG